MTDEMMKDIEQAMLPLLNNAQMKALHHALQRAQWKQETATSNNTAATNAEGNKALLKAFLSAKQVEGCSLRTIQYYRTVITRLIQAFTIPISHITTDDLRAYLTACQQANNCSKVNIDNIRRILSSFFSWLEDENHILKSPVRRIRKIKTCTTVKETYSDEALEVMRDSCTHLRDLAVVDLLSSTGMRVGELVTLDKHDISFEDRECIVLGKGGKERPVYFDARSKIHLQNYLSTRTDSNPALFVSLLRPYKRLGISGVEIRLRQLGRHLAIDRVHPHKFRRTLATKAIDKGMPIEQVQQLLGHAKIDTTLQYAMVSQNNVRMSHRKYLG